MACQRQRRLERGALSQKLRLLIDSWFAGRSSEIEQLSLIDEFESVKSQLLREGSATYNVEDLKDEENIVVRNGAFRKIVVSLYDQRYARTTTGRLTTAGLRWMMTTKL